MRFLLICAFLLGAAALHAEEASEYTVQPAPAQPELRGDWEGPVWKDAPLAEITHFYRTDETHRPKIQVKALYDESGVYIHFRVEDRYVRAVCAEYHGKVWEDACVEFFVQPREDRGYFNFEISCAGWMLLSYKENPEWKGDVLAESGSVPWELAQKVTIWHSLPNRVEPERQEPVVWQVEYHIPREIFETYLGPLGDFAGQEWRANFYKCAENNSHPHWASWSPIQGKLDFHQPQYFGRLRFAE